MIRRSITGQAVCRSDREIMAWSWPSGAPSTAATASAAVTPGTTVTSIASSAISSAGLPMA